MQQFTPKYNGLKQSHLFVPCFCRSVLRVQLIWMVLLLVCMGSSWPAAAQQSVSAPQTGGCWLDGCLDHMICHLPQNDPTLILAMVPRTAGGKAPMYKHISSLCHWGFSCPIGYSKLHIQIQSPCGRGPPRGMYPGRQFATAGFLYFFTLGLKSVEQLLLTQLVARNIKNKKPIVMLARRSNIKVFWALTTFFSFSLAPYLVF